MDMQDDKAIIKALKSQESSVLSPDFNTRLMGKVYLAAEKRKKRAYILSLCFLSAVSLGLIAMGIYLLKDYLPSDYTIHFPSFKNLLGSLSRYGFGFYIAFLILILVGLDTYFRQLLNKRKNHKYNHYN
ncbi:MAG: hypothetical protein PHT07_05980 [Paludibacter sp.]|nr:hypothetical protein [Paludibacter sp.]